MFDCVFDYQDECRGSQPSWSSLSSTVNRSGELTRASAERAYTEPATGTRTHLGGMT
jgi:hypothetical protein